MPSPQIAEQLSKGMTMLESVTGSTPTCSAAPAWRCTEGVLQEKLAFPFAYNSDCRGSGIFRPKISGDQQAQPQVPCTLPTLDEVVGKDGKSAEDYYRDLLRGFEEPGLKVLTMHAEAEGIAYAGLFDSFVSSALERGHCFVPLSRLLAEAESLPCHEMTRQEIPGREGWLSVQSAAPILTPST